MCHSKEILKHFVKYDHRNDVSLGNGSKVSIFGEGKVVAGVALEGILKIFEIKRVLYLTTLTCNLLSVSEMRKAGLKTKFSSDQNNKGFCEISKANEKEVITVALERIEGLY